MADYVSPSIQPASRKLSSQEIVERVIFPLVNEGFKILEEGMAQRPSDIDVVYLYGYGWPAWRGGPMYWADEEVGLPHLLETLRRLHKAFPGSDHFCPSQLLEECVAKGVTLAKYWRKHRKGVNGKGNTPRSRL